MKHGKRTLQIGTVIAVLGAGGVLAASGGVEKEVLTEVGDIDNTRKIPAGTDKVIVTAAVSSGKPWELICTGIKGELLVHSLIEDSKTITVSLVTDTTQGKIQKVFCNVFDSSSGQPLDANLRFS